MIKIFPDIESLNNFAAEKFFEIAKHAIESRGLFVVALSGGSTPKALYRLLTAEFKSKIDWSKVSFFFGDERNVPPDDEQSNFQMARENLFAPLKISDENIRRWKTEFKDAETTCFEYECRIWDFFLEREELLKQVDEFKCPSFDLILLGMGADGHTASLFPFSPALRQDEEIVFPNFVEKLNETRLTFTFRLINSAANILFLVSGVSKAEALREVLEGEYQPDKFPAQKVKPNNGNLIWLVDAQAARLLQ